VERDGAPHVGEALRGNGGELVAAGFAGQFGAAAQPRKVGLGVDVVVVGVVFGRITERRTRGRRPRSGALAAAEAHLVARGSHR